jgi:hypothetical protein
VDETGLFQPCLFQDPVDKPGSQILFRMGNSDDTRLCLMNELVVVSPDPVQSPSVRFNDCDHLFRAFVFDRHRLLSGAFSVTLIFISVNKIPVKIGSRGLHHIDSHSSRKRTLYGNSRIFQGKIKKKVFHPPLTGRYIPYIISLQFTDASSEVSPRTERGSGGSMLTEIFSCPYHPADFFIHFTPPHPGRKQFIRQPFCTCF